MPLLHRLGVVDRLLSFTRTSSCRTPFVISWLGISAGLVLALSGETATGTITSTVAPVAYRRAPEPDSASTVARVALAPARGLTWLLSQPARGVAWLVDVLELPATPEALFFDETLTYGAYPVLGVETPFGLRVGATAVHRSVFGEGERVEATAQFGGRLDQLYDLRLGSGARLAPLRLGLRGRYEAVPRLVFDGVSPDRGPRAAVSRRTVTAGAEAAVQLGAATSVGLELGWWNDAYGPPGDRVDDPFAGDLYALDPYTLGGEDLDTIEAALELRYDGRVSAGRFTPPARPSRGLQAALRAGYNRVVERSGPAFLRVVLDLEQRIPLIDGRRALALRARWSGVGGAGGEIPVFDLPALGGPTRLRGYARGAVRGRQALLASAEYLFPLSSLFAGYVFADVGAAFEQLEQLGGAAPIEAGFGGGLELFSWRRVLGRVQVAVSRRGDVQLSFGVGTEPQLDGRQR